MKITPILTGGNAGTDIGNINLGATASPDKLERAKKIAQGITLTQSDTPTDPTIQRAQQTVRKIQMRTNASPDREIQVPVEENRPLPANSDVTPAVEDTKPLSPQLAELAKQRRALQVKEREIADREKALASQPTSVGAEDLVARLKSEPLSVLQEHGVTYDQLTEALLSNQSNNPEIAQLKAEIKALKEGVDKTLSDRDLQQEQQVLAEIQRDIDQRASSGDDYEMIRATQSQSDVKELIHRTFKETGEILDTPEAMRLIEEELIKDTLKVASTNKIKSRLLPTPPQQQQPPKQFRTLTNRDTAQPIGDRRSRAIAAALGTLKR